MDIKAKIDELVDKVKGDPELFSKFQSDPAGAVEGLLGVDLPEEQINKVVEGVKAKIKLDEVGDKLSGLFGKKS